MNTEESFSNATYIDQMHIAEGELSAFISAVTQLFGPEQARLTAEDWLEEAEVVDSAPRYRCLIRKYRGYHRLIVLPPRFWCDALIATDAIGNAQQTFFRKTGGTVL